MLIGIDANEANLTDMRVGINQYAFHLLWAIYRLNTPHSFCVYLKSAPRADLPAPRPGWTYRVLPFPKLWTQTRLPWDLYLHRPRPEIFLSLTHYAPRFCPLPSVITIMDIGYLHTPQQFTATAYRQLKNWTEYSVRQAAKIIAISNFTKQDLLTTYPFLNAQKVIVSYPSYDSSRFQPTHDQSVLTKYQIKSPYVFFLSSLKPSKNVEGLLAAFQKLVGSPRPAFSDLNLVIAGKKAWLYQQIFTQVRQLRLSDRVIFTGFVDETDVPALMTHARAFVLPSFHEGFGIPVLEAMACGTPVVISKVASLPEVAGPAGIYVNPHDPNSIASGLKVALGPARARYIKSGRKRVKLFSWDKSAQEVMAVLENSARSCPT